MLKKIILIMIFISQLAISARSQVVPYKILDSLSAEISQKQFRADTLSYTNDEGEVMVQFSEKNFNLLVSSRLASMAVYKYRNRTDILELIDNINLKKAISVSRIDSYERVTVFRVMFASNINVNIYDSVGVFVKSTIKNYVDFHVKKIEHRSDKPSDYETWSFYNTLITLCHFLKREGSSFSHDPVLLARSWNKAIDEQKVEGFETFLKKYPKTLYEIEARRQIALLNSQ
ncbi:hypothetical protein [Pedobacter sp. B4-66]|uniref:hypothetical protein n=1 Tax=Pedobacter sp. B4-66 TaxID=2817280 RepID=UPI001BDA7A52|nr:hypothetical protein [Pedobacter sp. B4-66]